MYAHVLSFPKLKSLTDDACFSASAIVSGAYLGLVGALAGGLDGAVYGAWTATSVMCTSELKDFGTLTWVTRQALRVPTALLAMRHGALGLGKTFAMTGVLTEPLLSAAEALDLSNVYPRVASVGVFLCAFNRMIIVPKGPASGAAIVTLPLVAYTADRFVLPSVLR